MIRYSCKDMGLNCKFMVTGEDIEEVTKQALDHVREKHTADFNAINSPSEIKEMEKSLARSTHLVAG